MKHKEKKKHLESRYLKPVKKSKELNLQEHPLQHKEAGEDSYSSDYSTIISPMNKQSGADIKTFEEYAPQVLAEVPGGGPTEERSCSSEYFSCVSTLSKPPPPDTQDIRKIQEYAPQSQICVEAPGCGPPKESFPSSHHLTRVSSPSRHFQPNNHDIKTFEEYAPQVLAEVPGGGPTEERSCSSEYFSCVSTLSKPPPPDTQGIRKIQEYAPQSQICVEAPGCGPPKESFPSSHHLTRVSSPSRHFQPNNHGTLVTPVPMDLQQAEISSPSPHASSPFHLFGNNKPCTSSVPERDERVMTIYYMRVQMKRGRVVLEDPEEGGQEPSSKKIKIEEMTYIEKGFENIPFSQMSKKRPLVNCRPYLYSRAQKKEKVEWPAMPPALQVYHRARNPEWPVARSSGFRCMACCHIFPSLEVLKEHVTHGFKEGFSCHTFHVALACLKHKDWKEEEEGN